MTSTTWNVNFAAVLLLAMAVAGPAQSKDTLSIKADAPVVPLLPRAPGRNSLRLPTLEYQFEIQVRCTENRSPASLSLNVADTRKSLAADEIATDGPTAFSLKIPASQMAPLVVENFCVAQDRDAGEHDSASRDRVTIPAALSAQVSLLCESADDKVMTYVSQPLDVSLLCEDATGDEDSDDHQTRID